MNLAAVVNAKFRCGSEWADRSVDFFAFDPESPHASCGPIADHRKHSKGSASYWKISGSHGSDLISQSRTVTVLPVVSYTRARYGKLTAVASLAVTRIAASQSESESVSRGGGSPIAKRDARVTIDACSIGPLAVTEHDQTRCQQTRRSWTCTQRNPGR